MPFNYLMFLLLGNFSYQRYHLELNSVCVRMPIRVTVQVRDTSEGTLSESKSIEEKCWAWSVTPLVIMAQLIGVDLTNSSAPTVASLHHRKRWILFLRSFLLLVNLVVNIDSLVVFHDSLLELSFYFLDTGEILTKTFLWNLVIDVFNIIVSNFFGHVFLLFVVRRRWPCLCDAFKQSQQLGLRDTDSYSRVRIISWCGLIYILLGVFKFVLIVLLIAE